MALADRLGKFKSEVLDMTVSDFNEWLAYLEVRENKWRKS
jgi:hypothetical protein|tara:strand:- start:3544 stop:3663 length:120 start_codon:yes stop_codon:yes gene_type:complete